MEKNCPMCFQQITTINRLITENCGHLKCRQCFISEENSCAECEKLVKSDRKLSKSPGFDTNTEANPNNVNSLDEKSKKNTIAIIENIVIEPRKIKNLAKNKISRPHIIKLDNSAGYKCTICNKDFKSRSQQYYHISCDLDKKLFCCTKCPKSFSSSYHLKYHLLSHRINKKKVTCSICSKEFANEITFQKHFKCHNISKKLKCNLCDKVYKDISSYKAHLNKHNNIFPYQCKNCNKKFTSKYNLSKHLQIYKANEKIYKCELCINSFYYKSSLKVHQLKHSNKNSFNCKNCQKKFSERKALIRHENLHNDSPQYQCDICYLQSTRKDNLMRHIKNMHPNENPVNVIKINKLNSINSEDKLEVNELNVEKSREPYTANNSVIKSIGNVKPLVTTAEIPITEDKSSILNSQEQNSSKTFEIKKQTVSKKNKKNYDPCEIYRKILFASNDEDETVDDTANSGDTSNDCLIESDVKSISSSTTQNFNTTLGPNLHWRKNFTYHYTNNS